MLTVEVDIGLRPSTLTPTTQLDMVDFRVSHFSCLDDRNVHKDNRVGYSGHGNERNGISGDGGD